MSYMEVALVVPVAICQMWTISAAESMTSIAPHLSGQLNISWSQSVYFVISQPQIAG